MRERRELHERERESSHMEHSLMDSPRELNSVLLQNVASYLQHQTLRCDMARSYYPDVSDITVRLPYVTQE